MANVMNEEFYYNPQQLLTYNSLWNFIIGERGNGKTYAFKKLCIKGWIKKQEQFVWIRRYDTELDDINLFFADIGSIYPDHEFKAEGGKFYCNNEIMGYYFPLSKGLTKKSVSYARVKRIVFDEFLINKSAYRYLKNEVSCLLDVYETIARLRDIPIYLVANTISEVNPYWTYFGIKLTGRFTRVKEDLIVEKTDSKYYKEIKKQSRFGKFTAGTGYDKYAIEGNFIEDNYAFIEEKSEKALNIFNVKFQNSIIGIWRDTTLGKLYCSKKHNPTLTTYCITTEDMQPNYLILKSKSNYMQLLKTSYEYGFIYFENIQIKGIMLNVQKYLQIK